MVVACLEAKSASSAQGRRRHPHWPKVLLTLVLLTVDHACTVAPAPQSHARLASLLGRGCAQRLKAQPGAVICGGVWMDGVFGEWGLVRQQGLNYWHKTQFGE